MKIKFPKYLVVVTGDGQETMFDALDCAALPADNIKVSDLLKKVVRDNNPGMKKYQLIRMIDQGKMVSSNCINTVLGSYLMINTQKLLDSPFDALVIMGGMKTILQVEHLLNPSQFEFSRILLIVGSGSRFATKKYLDYLESVRSWKSQFDYTLFDPERVSEEVERIIYDFELPVVLSQMHVAVSNPSMDPRLSFERGLDISKLGTKSALG